MKKMITIVAMAIVVLILNAATVNAADGDYTFKIENGYAVITGYTGSGGEITIPEILAGCKVKVIGNYAFDSNSKITKVTMPNTIVEIGIASFAFCTALEEVKFSNTLQVVKREAFVDCPKLKEINLPKTFARADLDCFSFCSSLTAINVDKEEKLQDGYFSIDGVLFCNGIFGGEKVVMLVAYPGNKEATEYVVPDYVTYTHSSFTYLQNLTRLIIPSSVAYIGIDMISETVKAIDIILKHNEVPSKGIGYAAFGKLASGSRIICKNEDVRSAAEYGIYGSNGVTAVIASDANAFVPATSLELTSPSKITVKPGDIAYVSWKQAPVGTTDNVAWEITGSTDPDGLTIEPQTGKIKAIYRGSYTVTGKDESGHEISVQLTVSTKVADVGLGFQEIPSFDGVNADKLVAGKAYRVYAGFDLLLSGINVYKEDITGIYSTWDASGKIYNESPDSEYRSSVSIYFVPDKAGAQTLSYVCKDKNNEVLAKGSTPIYVYANPDSVPSDLEEPKTQEQTMLAGTASYTKTYGDADFALDITANASQKLQYASSNTSVAMVTPAGKVSIKGAGEASITVKVSGDASYTDAEKKVAIKASPRAISSASLEKIADQPYTGNEIKPSIKATYKGNTLMAGTDYKLSYKDNKKTGTATITASGINNFSGSRKATFQIVTVGKPSSLSQNAGKSTTSSIQLSWKKADSAEGYQIYRSTKKNSGYSNIATISSLTTYTDKKLKSGTTYYYKVRAYRKISGATRTGSYSSILAASTKTGKVTLKLKSVSKKAVLSWKPVKGAAGYEVYRSTSKNGKYSKIKTLTKGTAKSYTDGKVSAKKTYFYKVQAYRTIEGTKVNSGFSNVGNLKIK